jgi:hypothetical protein
MHMQRASQLALPSATATVRVGLLVHVVVLITNAAVSASTATPATVIASLPLCK